MSLLRTVSGIAGAVNAANRNALAAQRLALQQQHQQLLATAINHQMAVAAQQEQQRQLHREQVASIDRLEAAVADTKRLAQRDPVEGVLRARTLLSNGFPSPEWFDELEHKRVVREARATLDSLSESLSQADRTRVAQREEEAQRAQDEQNFQRLRNDPPRLKAAVQTALANVASEDFQRAAAETRAAPAARWTKRSGLVVAATLAVAVLCGAVITAIAPPVAAPSATATTSPTRGAARQKTTPAVPSPPKLTLAVSVSLLALLDLAALAGALATLGVSGVLSILNKRHVRKATESYKRAAYQVECARGEEAAFWARPDGGVLLNAILARRQHLPTAPYR